MRNVSAILGMVFILLAPYSVFAGSDVLFVVPRVATFWQVYVDFAKAAGKDLGLEIEVIWGNDDRYFMKQAVESRLESDSPPEVIMFNNFQGMGSKFIKMTQKYEVKALLVNSQLSDEHREELGVPRDLYPNWIGDIVPADRDTARKASKLLIDEAFRKHAYVSIIGLSGPLKNGSSMQREAGLYDVLASNPYATLNQLVNIPKMSRLDSKRRFTGLIKRYSKSNVVWSSNSQIHNGAFEAALEMGIKPGQQLVFGVLDIDDHILKKITTGEIVCATGGHYTEGAWAAVLLYDYLNGRDFAEESTRFTSPMAVVTQSNAELFSNKFHINNLGSDSIDKIDFSIYSKVKNPSLDKYNFSMDDLLDKF